MLAKASPQIETVLLPALGGKSLLLRALHLVSCSRRLEMSGLEPPASCLQSRRSAN